MTQPPVESAVPLAMLLHDDHAVFASPALVLAERAFIVIVVDAGSVFVHERVPQELLVTLIGADVKVPEET